MKKKPEFKQTELGSFPEDWKISTIEDIAEVVGGTTPSTNEPDNYGGNISWLTPKDLSNYRFRYIGKGERSITEKGMKSKGIKLLPKGTVLLTTRAPIGYVAIAENELTTNQGFRNLVPGKKVDSEFLYYLLKNNIDRLISNASGTTFSELSGGTLKKMKFVFPQLEEQKAIGAILSSLDAKIELNIKINRVLETIGQALFKRWFIDFEFPDEKRRPYKSSGGEMVDSELGKIPKGWRIGTLGNICNITMGQSPPGETYNEEEKGLPFYQGVVDFDFRFPKLRVYCTFPTRFANEADILLSVRAPVGRLNIADKHCAIGRGLAALNLKKGYAGYIYYLLSAHKSYWDKYEAEGTVFGCANKSDIHDMKIIIPIENIKSIYDEIIMALDENIKRMSKEINILTLIRDSLLPRLMSGKIRVPIEARE